MLAKWHFEHFFSVAADSPRRTDLLCFLPAVSSLGFPHPTTNGYHAIIQLQLPAFTCLSLTQLEQHLTAFHFWFLSRLQSSHHWTECLARCESSQLGSSDSRSTRSCWWTFCSTLNTVWGKFQTGLKLPVSSSFCSHHQLTSHSVAWRRDKWCCSSYIGFEYWGSWNHWA